jgi:4-amino-4-deoxy-L-arabinose transferase-like glycosyltransferase
MTSAEMLADVARPKSAKRPATQAAPSAAKPLWEKLALGAVLALATFLDFWNLNQNGYGNTYYATAVKSMMTSWHNAYFATFDAQGFLSIDKPPLGFWLQVLSAKIFGFSGFSLMLP